MSDMFHWLPDTIVHIDNPQGWTGWTVHYYLDSQTWDTLDVSLTLRGRNPSLRSIHGDTLEEDMCYINGRRNHPGMLNTR